MKTSLVRTTFVVLATATLRSRRAIGPNSASKDAIVKFCVVSNPTVLESEVRKLKYNALSSGGMRRSFMAVIIRHSMRHTEGTGWRIAGFI